MEIEFYCNIYGLFGDDGHNIFIICQFILVQTRNIYKSRSYSGVYILAVFYSAINPLIIIVSGLSSLTANCCIRMKFLPTKKSVKFIVKTSIVIC